MAFRRRWRGRSSLVAMGSFSWVLLAAPLLGADGPVAHEYFDFDEREDLTFGATTQSGTMPAAIDTPSGVVRAPRPERASKSGERVYGGNATPHSPDAVYRIDRNTSRPEVVGYDDPFNPSIVPYKRLYAFDAVSESFELMVSDPKLVQLEVGGPARAGDDQFYGDLVVDLRASEPVRIPSVGPGARMLSYETFPRVELTLWRDGADNWFVQGKEQRRIRLTLQLAIERSVFGGDLPDPDYQLLPKAPSLPPAVSNAVAVVLTRLDLERTTRPRAALESLVAHFRGFKASNQLPVGSGPAELYQELALGQKGVCRHRAYAFVLTALGLGLPARFVRNEAHAWVEVQLGSWWRRIDLGGAAARFNVDAAQDSFEHIPPGDPFSWPRGSESTETATRRRAGPAGPPGTDPPLPPDPPRPLPIASADALAPSEISVTPPQRAESAINLTGAAESALRGTPLRVEGRVVSGDTPCAGLRLDVALRSARGLVAPLGSIPTDQDGSFSGSVTVHPTLEVGDYRLVLSTPGNSICGPGRWE